MIIKNERGLFDMMINKRLINTVEVGSYRYRHRYKILSMGVTIAISMGVTKLGGLR